MPAKILFARPKCLSGTGRSLYITLKILIDKLDA